MIHKKIILLGATGSIGTNTLNVLRANCDKFELVGISCNENFTKLSAIANEFKVKHVAVTSKKISHDSLKKYFANNVIIFRGENALVDLVKNVDATAVVVSVVGVSGILPTVEAIKTGKDILLASKEVLVCAGEIVMNLTKKYNVNLLPIDSEHNAIFQCLYGNKTLNIARLILTASGGALRDFSLENLKKVSPEQALSHPNWQMGKRITIDSATFANKGLEVIEACWLFCCDASKIEVVIHRQSIIHSMVEFVDGAVIAQMSPTSMEFPIRNCLFYPERAPHNISLDFAKNFNLTFETPDKNRTRCLQLAYDCLLSNDSSAIVFNAADEVAVDAFIKKEIGFLQIQECIENVLNKCKHNLVCDLQNVFDIDSNARVLAYKEIQKLSLRSF